MSENTAAENSVTRRNFLETMGAMGAMGAGLMATMGMNASEAEAVEYNEKNFTENISDLYTPLGRVVNDVDNAKLDEMLLDQTLVTEDFVCPSGKVIPAVYVNLRNKLNRIGDGFGSDIDGNENAWDWLMIAFSEEDAAHELELPMYQTFNAQDYAAVSGRDIEECRQILEDMAGKGLLLKHKRAGVNWYDLMTMEPGIWDHNAHRWAEPDWVEAHAYAIGTDKLVTWNETNVPQLMVMPVSPDVVDGEMAPYTNWEESIRNHEVIAVMPCQCRLGKQTMGTRDPGCHENHGDNTCIFMGDFAQCVIDRGVGQQITPDECVEMVRNNIDHGLVPEMVWNKTQDVLCECCGDSCGILGKRGGYLAYDCQGEIMKHCSLYDLIYDKEACIQCGACVDRCTMGAISVGDDGYMVNDYHCVRCGQCAYICPAQARKLRVSPDHDEVWRLQDDWRAKELSKARKRMAEGFVRDFLGDEQDFLGNSANGTSFEDHVAHEL